MCTEQLFVPEVSGPTPGQSNPDLSTSSTVTLPPKSFSSGSGSLKRAAAPVSPVAATAGAAAGSATGGSGGEAAVVSAYKWEDESNGEIYTDVPLTASASEVSKVEKILFEGPQLKSVKSLKKLQLLKKYPGITRKSKFPIADKFQQYYCR